MSLGSVLVIEDDEWVSRLLTTAIRDAGYEVVVCGTASAGLEAACAQEPDCIICDVDLPDKDGYWVARNVRTHPSRLSVTPFLFLSGLDDEQSRLEGFHVGADVYMTKPFRVDEVVAQIGALVKMASRLKYKRDSMFAAAPAAASAIEGDLGQMSIATVLTVLEMERRSGVFEVVSKKRKASLDVASGNVVEGMVGGTKVSALAAVRTMLGWTVGRFSFTPTAAREAPGGHKSLGAFLIEAMRLEDESARVELDLPPSRRASMFESKIPPPSLGGPGSSPADFAPPSSRTPDFVRAAPAGVPLPAPSAPTLDSELIEWEEAADPLPPTPAPKPLNLPRLNAIPPPGLAKKPTSTVPTPAPPASARVPPIGPPRPPRPDPGDKKR